MTLADGLIPLNWHLRRTKGNAMKVAADHDTATTEEPTLAAAVHRRVDEVAGCGVYWLLSGNDSTRLLGPATGRAPFRRAPRQDSPVRAGCVARAWRQNDCSLR